MASKAPNRERGAMQNSPQRTMGVRLREARLRREMSQEDVAEALGIHPMTISKYERDQQDPNTARLAALAEALDVSSDWLLTEHEEFAHHGLKSQERVMVPVISYPSLVVRVRKDTFSEETIENLGILVKYALWLEKERRDRQDA